MKIWQRIGLIILSSLLITLSIEPFAFHLLAFVAWIPFLIALRDTTFRVGFRLGILQGFLTFAGTLIWLFAIFESLAPALWFTLALFTGILGTHFKNHIVHLFNDGEKGITAKAINTPIGKIGTPICFDCDHQDVIRKMTADGAELFLIPSMDAADWTERQHLQHGTLFRHRAAENGRWLAIASTSGLTQIIGPNGHSSAHLPLMEEGVLTGQISPLQRRTFFQRGGWLFGPACLFGTVALILWSVISGLKDRRLSNASTLPPESPPTPATEPSS
jgi:apolipoprotein N-acyltransferase